MNPADGALELTVIEIGSVSFERKYPESIFDVNFIFSSVKTTG